jgi:hypothetical protein
MIPTVQGGRSRISPLAAFATLQAMVAMGPLMDIQRYFPTVGFNLDRRHRTNLSHTKKGPGRRHLQGSGSKEARRRMTAPGCTIAVNDEG